MKPQRLVAIAKFNTCKWFSIKSKRVMTFLTHELSKQRGDKSNFDDKVQVASKKKKIDELDFIKIKIFCASKNAIKKGNIPPTEREEIPANHTSDKDLISRMYNKLT